MIWCEKVLPLEVSFRFLPTLGFHPGSVAMASAVSRSTVKSTELFSSTMTQSSTLKKGRKMIYFRLKQFHEKKSYRACT